MKENVDLKFISDLQLAEIPQSVAGLSLPSVSLLEETPSASVVGNSVIAFTSKVQGQQRNDLKNATCLAQLAAMKKHDPFTDTENFYRFYTEVLANIGFVVQGFDFTKHEVSGSTLAVDKVVIEVLAAIATEDEVALVKASLDALKALSDDDGRLRLFSTSSHSAEYANFMLGVANQSDNGDVAFKVGAFHMNSTENNTRFLWFSYSTSNTNLFKSGQVLTLNEDVYSRNRATIIDKLGDKAEKYIANLEL
ncbi:hypothetical protein CN964_21270 [Bacillus cereus]|uniref:hypothetical protein n=1 Tax=Bacillus cereus TaxID=1396 RepID=UPI000BF55120|nr:hypothetical protein [Bacillus cereus]PFJ30942.1 hypothetical protein COI90_20725 [Bacillus cereus]PFO23930.1 hypothetical protein COJ80_16630 [Bacillus cereus]PGN71173.1 hypothetical protein CN964_21270 [Bacillus cereus]